MKPLTAVEAVNQLCADLPKFRQVWGMTQAEFADFLGFTQAAVSAWERGLRVPDRATEDQIRLRLLERMLPQREPASPPRRRRTLAECRVA